jgi:hypothetical protein
VSGPMFYRRILSFHSGTIVGDFLAAAGLTASNEANAGGRW